MPIGPELEPTPGVLNLDCQGFVQREVRREVRRFAIRYVSVPTREQMRAILATIDDAVARNRRVYVLC